MFLSFSPSYKEETDKVEQCVSIHTDTNAFCSTEVYWNTAEQNMGIMALWTITSPNVCKNLPSESTPTLVKSLWIFEDIELYAVIINLINRRKILLVTMLQWNWGQGEKCIEVVTSLPSKADLCNRFLMTLSIIKHIKLVLQIPDGKQLQNTSKRTVHLLFQPLFAKPCVNKNTGW